MDKYDAIRRILQQKQQALIDRIEAIGNDKKRHDEPLSRDFEEQAIELENDEVIDTLDENSRKEFFAISDALRRIKTGEYGICSECGATIPMERLQAMPYTDKCVDCASDSER
jgi:RNA polymerase-binding protein DksA